MHVEIILEADGSIPDIADDIKFGKVREAELTHITALPRGMQSGRTSVAFVGRTRSGQRVFMETSLRMLQAAAAAFTAKYGDES